jgi:hypothetical protein
LSELSAHIAPAFVCGCFHGVGCSSADCRNRNMNSANCRCYSMAAFAVGFGGWIFTYATKQAGLSEHEGHSVNAAYW